MKKLGRVKLAFSQRVGEKSWIIVATNNLKWRAKKCIEHYKNRWGIEVFFKMSKQHLGLGDYQFLRYRAVERYLHLVLIAYHLLTHLAKTRTSEKASSIGRTPLRLPSVTSMQAILRGILMEDTVNSLAEGKKYKKIAKKLKSLLVDQDQKIT